MQKDVASSMKEIQNVKPDVEIEPQRSHGNVSYVHQHCRSKSKQRYKKLGWKVSFLRLGSDSPAFQTAQTREVNPPPGKSSVFNFVEQIPNRGKSGGGTL